MTGGWLAGLLSQRRGRLAGLAVGVAITVALLASLGSFIAAAKAGMTRQALRGIAVDWQVAVAANADPRAVLDTTRTEPGTRSALPVGYASSLGLSATTVGPGGGPASRQTTGAATVLGWPADYATTFPGTVRLLAGSLDLTVPATGHAAPPARPAPPALLAQQTAANLRARPGELVSVGRAGLAPVRVRVVGVVDLPQADSLFQRVGAPAGAQPSAPPDNVAVLDGPAWTAAFGRLAAARPDLVAWQVHAARDRALPADPAAAYAQVLGQAHHLEARLAGAGIVGDNLAASLDAARADALYAQVLFVFLGLPAAVLAALLTVTLAGAGVSRRRREAALLRLRGAQVGTAVRLAAVEAAVVAAAGIVLGVAAAAVIGRTAFGSVSFGATTAAAVGWMGLAAGLGGLLAAAAIVAPAWRDARAVRVAASAAAGRRPAVRAPRWALLGLDVVLLAAAGLAYSVTSRSGYSLVLAPEGVPTVSVSYWAFAGPALLWIGAGLLTYRLVDLLLRRGRRLTAAGLRPVAGPLAGLSAASMARQRRPLARATVLAALAVTFAASTALFNTTYAAQADVDARLTNGADVTVSEPPTAAVGPEAAARIAAVPGVARVEPLQHRYAYVGADLQDLFGVRPATIAAATRLSDGYFTGGSARELVGRLAVQPDAVLVSAETVTDYQLRPGDRLTLRLTGTRGRLVPVAFHYAGIVKEFPTAPKDSFLVANAAYVAQSTGNDAVGSFLITTSDPPPTVAQRLRAALGPGPTVTDIVAARTAVGTSLTAIDLAGLTRVELGFGLLLALAAGGLVLGLSRAERRRELAIAAALGARRPQLRALLAGDALLVTVGGLAAGAATAAVLAYMLVAVLTGVFDPPPDRLSVPWAYLLAAAALTAAGTVTAAGIAVRRAGRALTATLRDA